MRSREENLAIYKNNNELEAYHIDKLVSLLSSDMLHVTPEFCKADAAFGRDGSDVLPLQLKSRHVSKKKRVPGQVFLRFC